MGRKLHVGSRRNKKNASSQVGAATGNREAEVTIQKWGTDARYIGSAFLCREPGEDARAHCDEQLHKVALLMSLCRGLS